MADESKEQKPKEWKPRGWYLLDTETGMVVVNSDGTAIGCWEMGPGFSIDTRPVFSLPTLRRLSGVVAVNSPPPRMHPTDGITLKELRDAGRILPENEEEKTEREKWEKKIKELVGGCFNKPNPTPDPEPPKA